MAATALKTVLYRPFPGGFFYGNNKSAAPESFLYAALWGGFLFCVRPGTLIMPSNVPHTIKNPGPINPGSFHSFKTTLIF